MVLGCPMVLGWVLLVASSGCSDDAASLPDGATDGDGSTAYDGRASDGRASDGRASDGRASDGRASDGRAHDGIVGDATDKDVGVIDQALSADSTAGQSSAGCGKAAKAGFTCFDLTFEGNKRSWCVAIPTSYDKQHPYQLVLGLHGCGGNRKNVHKHRKPMEADGESDFLFAYPQAKGSCWDYKQTPTTGNDISFIKHVIATMRAKYCIDLDRTFVHGMSSGGTMSSVVATAKLVQAFASASAGGVAHKTPAWYYGGKTDSYYQIIISAKEAQRKANGCAKTSKPISGAPCVRYDGCKQAVTYCEDNRGHVWPKESWAQGGILDFFRAVPR